MAISPQLRAFMKEHRISQHGLSERTGINQANISLIFNHHRSPTLRTLKQLADGMGIEVTTLTRLMENDNGKE